MEIIIGAATKMQNAMIKSETAGGSLVEARMLRSGPPAWVENAPRRLIRTAALFKARRAHAPGVS